MDDALHHAALLQHQQRMLYKALRVLPGKYTLPFRIDLTVMLDYPFFLLLVGDGSIAFATREDDNRKIEDIAKPSGKPNQDYASFNNSLPLGTSTDISVVYHPDAMQITVDGKERFFSNKQAYRKAKNLQTLNAEGFSVALAVSKGSVLKIKEITVTKLSENALPQGSFHESMRPRPASEASPKPVFETMISALPRSIRDALNETDRFLTGLRPLKFKRILDKNGSKISYVASEQGISYTVNLHGAQLWHHFGWYIVTNGKPDTWHRIKDDMEETLLEIAKDDPHLSDRLFYALNDCVSCYGTDCLAKTRYTFNGKTRLSCHGRVLLRMCPGDFHDVREFMRYVNALAALKATCEPAPQEKLYVMKRRD